MAVNRIQLFHSPLALATLFLFSVAAVEADQPDTARSSFTARALLPATIDRAAADVEIVVERFSVTTPETIFVVGGKGGDRPLAFDHASVLAYRGQIEGIPGSRVFLSGRDGALTGRVEFGDGAGGYSIREADDGSGAFVGAPVSALRSIPPNVALCGVVDVPQDGGIAGTSVAAEQMRVIELAIETDYELFRLFDDLDATGAYVVELYAANSDVYMRDLNARFELTFVRLWDTPDDLFNEPSPLGPFREYWNENMGDVQRDLAQFTSGRRDFPFGGQAYLNALCGGVGYSVVGYMSGVVGGGVNNYDLRVTAHELGHNVGASHTHSYGLDDCQTTDGDARRGSIMSYCSQTRSGGNANTDIRFHTVPQADMRNHMNASGCLYNDCNGNGVDDAVDIGGGDSDDTNGNDIPDECEDCNDNGVLDPEDIQNGTSTDDDFNGVPDECQADCNENGVVDALDILNGTSDDLYGNGIPDECEPDCDGNGMSDYSQIQLDMSIDLNRDAILDACQDCDDDGTIDLDARNGAHDLWVVSHQIGDPPSRYHAITGARHQTADAGHVVEGNGVVVGADLNVYVTSSDDRVVRFDRDGAYIDDFVPAGGGGLANPQGLTFGANGNLYVASHNTHSIKAYAPDGTSLGDFISQGAGSPIEGPHALEFGPNGNLFVADHMDRVLEHDGTTGAYIGMFVDPADNGGLQEPRGMAFTPDGRLLVTSHATNQVLAYDATTGAFLGQFNDGGTEEALSLDSPWGIRMGPDGNVYVSRFDTSGDGAHSHPDQELEGDLHLSAARVYIFDLDLGYFMRSYVNGNDTGLQFPTGIAFLPGDTEDCNVNGLPDACDIANGTSEDANGNGIPDECEDEVECPSDVTGDGTVNVEDLVEVILQWGPCGTACSADINGDDIVNVEDLVEVILAWGEC